LPFNIVSFQEATPGTGTVGVAPGTGEDLYNVSGDNILVTKEAPYLLGVFAGAVTTGGQIILRQPKMVDIDIIKVAEVGMSSPTCFYTDLFGRAIKLRADKLQVLIVNATDEIASIGVMLGSGKITQAMKDAVNPTHIIHGYWDGTAVAHTWTYIPISWTETLDAGVYEIVGCKVGTYISSGWQAGVARLAIPGSKGWRPGVWTTRMLADHEEYQNERFAPYTQWPLMGIKFDTNHMRNLQLCVPPAITDLNVELTLQKVREDA